MTKNTLSSEMYSERCQKSKIEHFARTVNGLTGFAKASLLDVSRVLVFQCQNQYMSNG